MFLLPRSFLPVCTQHHTASTCNRQQQSQATKLAKSVLNSLHNTANCKTPQSTSESLTSSYFALPLLTQWNTSVPLTQSLCHNAPFTFKSRNTSASLASSYFATVSVQINKTLVHHLQQATLALSLFKSTKYQCITCTKLLWHCLCSNQQNTSVSLVPSYFGTVSVQIKKIPVYHLHQATLALSLFKSTKYQCITCTKLLCHCLCSNQQNTSVSLAASYFATVSVQINKIPVHHLQQASLPLSLFTCLEWVLS